MIIEGGRVDALQLVSCNVEVLRGQSRRQERVEMSAKTLIPNSFTESNRPSS